MKLEKLYLKAFGPFTDHVLDFSSTDHGLHIVAGQNEAGKSTALRAIKVLLYGFGHSTIEGWLHPNKNLVVAGDFRLNDGSPLCLSRFKRRKNDLIDTTNDRPFEQGKLENILGRMNKETFEHTFAISHDSLRLGVESVLAAGGDLGQALFAATSGLNTLKNVMAKIEQDQANLFTPRAKKAIINRSLSELRTLRKHQDASTTNTKQWAAQQQKIEDLLREEVTIENELEELAITTNLLNRYKKGLAYVTRFEELQEQLQQMEAVPNLRDDFSQTRIETQVNKEQLQLSLSQLETSCSQLKENLDQLNLETNLLNHEHHIETLSAEVTIHQKAQQDAKSLRFRRYQQQENSQKNLKLLRSTLTIDTVENLKISRAEYTKVLRLAAQGMKLQEGLSANTRMLTSSLDNLKTLEEVLIDPKTIAPHEYLAESISIASDSGRIDNQLRSSEEELSLVLQLLEIELNELPLFTGTIENLQLLPLPSSATIQSQENTQRRIHRKRDNILGEISIQLEKLRTLEKNHKDLVLHNKLPSQETLKEHRAIRDLGWRSIKRVWLQKAEPIQEFVQYHKEATTLQEAFEFSQQRADDTADILRENAQTIAQVEVIENDMDHIQKELKRLHERKSQLDEELRAEKDRWQKLWSPLGISPLSPVEMLSWLQKAQELKAKAKEATKIQSKISSLKTEIVEHETGIKQSLIQTGVEIPSQLTYSSLLSFAKKSLTQCEQQLQKRNAQLARIEALNGEIDKIKRRIHENREELQHWENQWQPYCHHFGYPPQTPIQDVQDFILALEEVFKEIDKSNELLSRQRGIENDYRNYSQRVEALIAELAPDLSNLTPEDGICKLKARLDEQKENQKSYQLLVAEYKKLSTSREEVCSKLKAHEKTMEILCLEANCNDAALLHEIEGQYRTKTKLVHEVHKITEQLTELAAGEQLDVFIGETKKQSHDKLQATLESLLEKQQSLKERQRNLVAASTLAKKELTNLDREAEALHTAEKAEALIVTTQQKVDQYLQLKIASAVLKQAIERYRQSNQSPVLQAASSFFKRITDESFVGLQSDYDEKGSPVLKARRDDGSLLFIDQLSDGSRDQLFLALRFGGLVRYVNNNGPMMFVVDDILVHFDDTRATAALNAMADISKKTQIIFFTHHQHLLELIENNSTSTPIYLHKLSS